MRQSGHKPGRKEERSMGKVIGDVFSGWDYPKYSCEEVRTCG